MVVTLFGGEPVPAVGRPPAVSARAPGLERSWLENPAEWLVAMFGGGASATGRSVTPMVALRSSGVWACVRVVSEDLASLPLIFYRRLSGAAKERAVDEPLYGILHDAPNDEMDAMQFVETLQAWSELWPCAYAEIVRDGAGRVVALWPLHPDLVTPLRIDGELAYRVQLPVGQTDGNGNPYRLLARELVFRIRGLSVDGVTGVGTVATQSEPIALALALEEHGARFFGNAGIPGGVLEHPGKLDDQVFERLKKSWADRHQGLKNAHRLAILEEGMKFNKMGVENDHAQFLESRRFQLEEQARIYRVPPHLIQDLTRSTNNNIEHQAIDFVMHSLRPRAVRWERAITQQLLTPAERRVYFAEFLLDALLRGDSKSRAETLAIKRQNGVINADEWRALDNENPLPDGQGEAYLVQVNMTTLEKIMAPAPKPAPPAGASPAATPTEDDQQDPQEDPQPAPPARSYRALMPLWVAELGRVARRQAKAVSAQVKKGNLRAFQDWAERYFRDEEEATRAAAEPLARALVDLVVDQEESPERHQLALAEAKARVETVAALWCRRALQEIGAAVHARPGDPLQAVEEVVGAWSDPATTEARASREFEIIRQAAA